MSLTPPLVTRTEGHSVTIRRDRGRHIANVPWRRKRELASCPTVDGYQEQAPGRLRRSCVGDGQESSVRRPAETGTVQVPVVLPVNCGDPALGTTEGGNDEHPALGWREPDESDEATVWRPRWISVRCRVRRQPERRPGTHQLHVDIVVPCFAVPDERDLVAVRGEGRSSLSTRKTCERHGSQRGTRDARRLSVRAYPALNE